MTPNAALCSTGESDWRTGKPTTPATEVEEVGQAAIGLVPSGIPANWLMTCPVARPAKPAAARSQRRRRSAPDAPGPRRSTDPAAGPWTAHPAARTPTSAGTPTPAGTDGVRRRLHPAPAGSLDRRQALVVQHDGYRRAPERAPRLRPQRPQRPDPPRRPASGEARSPRGRLRPPRRRPRWPAGPPRRHRPG